MFHTSAVSTMRQPIKMGIFDGDDKQSFNEDLLQCMRERKTLQVKEILQNCNPGDSTDNSKSNLLHYAARYGTNLTSYLVNAGCKVNAQNNLGKTPLILAVEESHELAVKDLLEANADLCITDNQGRSALQLACNAKICRSIRILEMCITKLGKQYAPDNEKIAKKLLEANCPLYFTMYLKNSAVTKILIDNGLDVNSRDPATGETALHVAATLTDVKNVQLLLDSGADVNAKDRLGRLPFFSGILLNNTDQGFEVFKILMARGLLLTSLNYKGEMQAYRIGSLDKKFAELIFEYDIDFMAEDAVGNTVLHYLARVEDVNFEKLKGKKFDTSARNKNGTTLLRLAFTYDNHNFVDFLMDNNAKIDHPNEELVQLLTPYEKFERDGTLMMIIHGRKDPKFVHALVKYVEGIEFVLKNYEKIFKYSLEEHDSMAEYVPAFVAMLDARGISISNNILQMINSDDELQKSCDIYKNELADMKKKYVSESVTLYELLTGDKSKIEFCMRNENIVARYDEFLGEFNLNSYLIKVLQKRVEKPHRLTKLKRAAFLPFCKITGMNVAAGNIIAANVFEYLEENDLKNVAEMQW